MSRGYGKVQSGCLTAIYESERAGKPPPTTYDIVAAVYRAKVDDGYWISDAQHVAVKRALEGLQRQGKVIGFERSAVRDDHDLYDGRRNHAYCWMSERRAQRWIREQREARAVLVETFKAKMREIGMKPK
jgi:hypothetical protein